MELRITRIKRIGFICRIRQIRSLTDFNNIVSDNVLIPGTVVLAGGEAEAGGHRCPRLESAEGYVAQQGALVLVLVVAAQLAQADVTLGQLAAFGFFDCT